MAMSRPAAWLAAAGCFLGMVACLVGLRYHRPRRARIAGQEVSMGGWKCEVCGKVADSLDAFDEPGYVKVDRPQFERHGKLSGRREVTRDGTGGSEGGR